MYGFMGTPEAYSSMIKSGKQAMGSMMPWYTKQIEIEERTEQLIMMRDLEATDVLERDFG